MEALHRCCCGLDVHQKTVVACLLTWEEGQSRSQVRSFSTMTPALLELLDWLKGAGCTHVAMESTGVYWQPVYNLLEGAFELLVVNTQHLKLVPGRKTDIQDACWIAQLLQHGLLRGSHVPGAPQRHLRELTRYRASLVADRARYVNRLHKVLESANLKLGAVVSDLQGKTAQRLLQCLAQGEGDPPALAQLGGERLSASVEELEAALTGRVTPHHRFLLGELLQRIAELEQAIGRANREIEARLRPFEAELGLLDGEPGINQRIAQVLWAEVGPDWSRFPSAGHLASWAGVCPGNHESGGKRRPGKTQHGNPWLKTALIEAAHGAVRTKGSYLSSQYYRLAARKGRKRALMAVAHSLLVIAYHLITEQRPYQDLGADYLLRRDREDRERRFVRGLQRLGYEVTLSPLPPAA